MSGPRQEATEQVSAALGVSSQNLELRTLTNSCGANQAQDFFEIRNNGTTSVKLSDLSIKFWVNDSTTAAQVVAAINTGGCLTGPGGNPSCAHPLTGVSATAKSFSPACGPDRIIRPTGRSPSPPTTPR